MSAVLFRPRASSPFYSTARFVVTGVASVLRLRLRQPASLDPHWGGMGNLLFIPKLLRATRLLNRIRDFPYQHSYGPPSYGRILLGRSYNTAGMTLADAGHADLSLPQPHVHSLGLCWWRCYIHMVLPL